MCIVRFSTRRWSLFSFGYRKRIWKAFIHFCTLVEDLNTIFNPVFRHVNSMLKYLHCSYSKVSQKFFLITECQQPIFVVNRVKPWNLWVSKKCKICLLIRLNCISGILFIDVIKEIVYIFSFEIESEWKDGEEIRLLEKSRWNLCETLTICIEFNRIAM